MYDLLAYPMLFPFGTDGRYSILRFTDAKGSQKMVSPLKLHSRFLFGKRCDFNILLYSGRLFQQYLCEKFVKVESGARIPRTVAIRKNAIDYWWNPTEPSCTIFFCVRTRMEAVFISYSWAPKFRGPTRITSRKSSYRLFWVWVWATSRSQRTWKVGEAHGLGWSMRLYSKPSTHSEP